MGSKPHDIEAELRARYLDLPTIAPETHARLRQELTTRAPTRPVRRQRRSLLIAAIVAALGTLTGSALGFGPLDAIQALNPYDTASIRKMGEGIDQNNRRNQPSVVLPVPNFSPAPSGTDARAAHHLCPRIRSPHSAVTALTQGED